MPTEPDTLRIDVRDVVFPREALAQRLRVAGNARREAELYAMIDGAEPLARPKAHCLRLEPRIEGDDVFFGPHRMRSRTLARTLGQIVRREDGSGAAFPFLATCGRELAGWAALQPAGLHAYWAQILLDMALQFAVRELERRLRSMSPGVLSRIEPGIPADWPITEQGTLFRLLEGGADALGVTLTDLCVMQPLKSLSGIFFFTERFLSPCTYCLFRCDRRQGHTCWRHDKLAAPDS